MTQRSKIMELGPATIGWAAVLAAGVGPFLPWVSGSSAAGQVYDLFFSSVSRPNAEWLVWFAAPLWTAAAGGVSLVRRSQLGLGVLAPCGVFLAAWAALLLTGYRAYTGFSDAGFAVTWAGTVGVGAVAVATRVGRAR
ncbi:hypothetical protein HQ560_19780 [bacterium]|nr:hypothetical protein [bacterium]